MQYSFSICAAPPTPLLRSLHHLIINNLTYNMSGSDIIQILCVAAAQIVHRNTIRGSVMNTIIPSILRTARRARINQFHARRRILVERKPFSKFAAKLTDKQFRRYFRMSKIYFQLLVDEIEDVVGSDNFKSERYLNNLVASEGDGSRNIAVAHLRSTGGMLSGEIKLALTLRVRGGGGHIWIWHSSSTYPSIMFIKLW